PGSTHTGAADLLGERELWRDVAGRGPGRPLRAAGGGEGGVGGAVRRPLAWGGGFCLSFCLLRRRLAPPCRAARRGAGHAPRPPPQPHPGPPRRERADRSVLPAGDPPLLPRPCRRVPA